jgi:lipopolysaccharide export system protein LptA
MRAVVAAIVLTLMAIGGSYWKRRSDASKASLPVAPVAKNVQQQASGYTFTRSDEGRQVFTIRASRTVAFREGGATVLEDVQVEVFGRDGRRRDMLRTRQCDYNQQSGDFFSAGEVEIELNAARPGELASPVSESIQLVTSQLYFRKAGALVESDQPVQFRYGAIRGSSLGLSYATREGSLELRRDVRAEYRPQGAETPPLSLAASKARFDKEKGEIQLAGPVQVIQTNRKAEATGATLSLDRRHRLTGAVFAGPVRASEAGGATARAGRLTAEFRPESGSLTRALAEEAVEVLSDRAAVRTRLLAQRLEVLFTGQPARAREGVAAGDVRIMQEPAGVSAEKRTFARREFLAPELRFDLQPSGKALREAATVGMGMLTMIPSDARLGLRTVTAERMIMRFGPESRLEMIRGEGGTRIRFEPGAGAPAASPVQESTSERLLATVGPETEAIEMVEQTGNFHFREGERQATAEVASYSTAREFLTLTGEPQIWDAEMRARAGKMLFDLASGRAEGIGKVESTHTGTAGRGEPVSVLADRVVVERRSQTVRYEGHVRAWRGSDVVESSTLEIWRAQRRISSGSQVLTSHLQPAAAVGGPGKTAGKPATRPATIRADHLEYSDQGRKATYRGNVLMRTENTTLEADQLVVTFQDRGSVSELDAAVADGNVRVTQPGRRATGRHAEYAARDGKIVLTGGPPTLYDAEKGFTSGQSLTFYSRDDRLVISGGDESTTISRHRIGQ